MENNGWYSMKYAQKVLGRSRVTIRRLIKQGKLSYAKMGNRYVFKMEDLHAYLDRAIEYHKVDAVKPLGDKDAESMFV